METSPAPHSHKELPSQAPWCLPNDLVDGGIVMASVIVVERKREGGDFAPADGGDWIAEQLLMRLFPSSPYFTVDLYDVTVFPAKHMHNYGRVFNIVEATALYEENGGDF